jgi:hypothetical protein
MKVIMTPSISPRRGDPVVVGNVYANAHGAPHYKVVVGMVLQDKWKRPYNRVVALHISATGAVVGASRYPEEYIREHNDLVGRVKSMPELKIEWLRPHPQAEKLKS